MLYSNGAEQVITELRGSASTVFLSDTRAQVAAQTVQVYREMLRAPRRV